MGVCVRCRGKLPVVLRSAHHPGFAALGTRTGQESRNCPSILHSIHHSFQLASSFNKASWFLHIPPHLRHRLAVSIASTTKASNSAPWLTSKVSIYLRTRYTPAILQQLQLTASSFQTPHPPRKRQLALKRLPSKMLSPTNGSRPLLSSTSHLPCPET